MAEKRDFRIPLLICFMHSRLKSCDKPWVSCRGMDYSKTNIYSQSFNTICDINEAKCDVCEETANEKTPLKQISVLMCQEHNRIKIGDDKWVEDWLIIPDSGEIEKFFAGCLVRQQPCDICKNKKGE